MGGRNIQCSWDFVSVYDYEVYLSLRRLKRLVMWEGEIFSDHGTLCLCTTKSESIIT